MICCTFINHLVHIAYVVHNRQFINICNYVVPFLPDHKPALSLVSFTANFSECLSTFTYSFQESCSLYPRCTLYFSVEHTVSPLSDSEDTFSGCTVEYTTQNLMRCQSYESIATAVLGNQRGNTVVVGDSVMLSE